MINRFAPVLFVLGILILGFGFLMLVPLSLSWLSANLRKSTIHDGRQMDESA